MTYQITLTHQAQEDLREIFRYIAVNLLSVQNASGQLARLEDAIASLSQMPERFRIYDNAKWKTRNLRMMPVDKYLVFYIPDSGSALVTVMRVLYGGRDIDTQLANSSFHSF